MPMFGRKKTPRDQITDALSDVRGTYHINCNEIGHGHYGVVHKCQKRSTGEWFAIKSIRKDKVSKPEVLLREIEILKEVNHPNIIRLVEVHEDGRYIHLITELCTGGELFDRIIAKSQSDEGHFSEGDAAVMVSRILEAIGYCHERHIVHRDLKPENFLFLTPDERSPIKIIDFGLSRHDDDRDNGVMKTKVGTPYYVAPEVLSRKYTKSCDIWSIGVITYILLCGYPPFYGESDTEIFYAVKKGKYDFPSPDWDDISDEAKDLISSLLKMDPSARPTALEALQHPWITNNTDTVKPRSERPGLSMSGTRHEMFKNYLGLKKLKKAALSYIAQNMTESEVGSLGETFFNMDRDNDGQLSLQDLDYALEHGQFSGELSRKLKRLRSDLQISGEKSLDWKEFFVATADRQVALKDSKVRDAFDFFRQSDNSYVSMSDLVAIFGGENQASEIMGEVDMDGDGKISFEEFRDMLFQQSAHTLEE